jgi:hypothetical protein
MVDVNAAKALQDENRFLEEVQATAERYRDDADNPLSAAIFESWKQGLVRHVASNLEMIGAAGGEDFDAWALEEEALMESFKNAANQASKPVRDAWHDYLDDEKQLLTRLRGAT